MVGMDTGKGRLIMGQISELAALCGVSERAVRKYCAQHKFRKFRNQWNLTKSQYSQVLSHYGRNQVPEPVEPNGCEGCGTGLVEADQLRAYEEQIQDLKKALEETNKRLSETLQLLNQEQQLHAETKKQLNLTLKALPAPPPVAPSQPAPEPPRSLWRRIFG